MNSLECDTSSEPCASGAAGSGLDRVTLAPSQLAVENLAPGDRVEHEVTVTNASKFDVTVSSAAEQSGALFEGSAAPELQVEWLSSAPNAPTTGSAQGCASGPVIPAGTSVELNLVVSLPATAGNEYQGLEGASLLTFTATQCTTEVATGPQFPELPVTGAQLGGLGVLAILVCAAGAMLFHHQHRRRHR